MQSTKSQKSQPQLAADCVSWWENFTTDSGVKTPKLESSAGGMCGRNRRLRSGVHFHLTPPKCPWHRRNGSLGGAKNPFWPEPGTRKSQDGERGMRKPRVKTEGAVGFRPAAKNIDSKML